ncbi:MAG TPA: hypothetical protein VJ750_00640 [Rhizomicrobium sp.]|nr:hypothetical protein [Rhizomicrobium sp.]
MSEFVAAAYERDELRTQKDYRPRAALGRAALRRSSLKSIHWIDLPGFAGRSSP